MLKRFSSLILALLIGSSVLAGMVRPSKEHVCKMTGVEMPTASSSLSHSHEMMPGMEMLLASPSLSHSNEMMPGMQMPTAAPTLSASHEMMPGMEMMPCCKRHRTQSVVSECCINIPQETGSSGTTFNLRLPSFNVAVIHPAILQPPITAPTPTECSYSTEVFLPNLQASYLRNLSFLI